MSTAAIPLYHPLHTLKAIGENIWIADGEIIHMSMAMIKLPFSTRMTVVRLQDGSLWCHSPIAPDERLLSAINALGDVRHLIAPNKLHYAFIKAWKDIYPQATAWASPGVRERAASQHIAVTFDKDLHDEAPSDWAADLDQHLFRGSRFMTEAVFFHRHSRTLILTDLIENFESGEMGWFWKSLIKLMGNADPDGKAPADLRATYFGNKKIARESLAHIMAWKPEKIILAHGRCYLKNGMAELQRAFRWLA